MDSQGFGRESLQASQTLPWKVAWRPGLSRRDVLTSLEIGHDEASTKTPDRA
jgi:hypothetical protein